MNSPFPGLDPYLERFWGDVHTRFMVSACDQIDDQLPCDLQARVVESLTVDAKDEWRTVYPDISVVEYPREAVTAHTVSPVAVAEPVIIPFPVKLPTQRHIEIIERNSGNRVVTVIELLSPANKVGQEGIRTCRAKQDEYRAAGVKLVEIDLIRQGSFVLAVPEVRLPVELRRSNVICVRRAGSARGAEVYRAALRETLPNIRIPLRPTDGDIVLQLQPLIDECYRRGRYSPIDYRSPPVPALSGDDEQWADRLLCGTGLR